MLSYEKPIEIFTVPVMVLIMRMATSSKIMGQFKVTGLWSWVGWLATGIMAVASLVFLASFALPGG